MAEVEYLSHATAHVMPLGPSPTCVGFQGATCTKVLHIPIHIHVLYNPHLNVGVGTFLHARAYEHFS
jgi:hypothetical protein